MPGPEVLADVAQVGGPTVACLDVADEVTAIGGHVEHRCVGRDEPLQVAADLDPDAVLGGGVSSAEAAFVQAVEVAARRLDRRLVARTDHYAASGSLVLVPAISA